MSSPRDSSPPLTIPFVPVWPTTAVIAGADDVHVIATIARYLSRPDAPAKVNAHLVLRAATLEHADEIIEQISRRLREGSPGAQRVCDLWFHLTERPLAIELENVARDVDADEIIVPLDVEGATEPDILELSRARRAVVFIGTRRTSSGTYSINTELSAAAAADDDDEEYNDFFGG